MVDSILSSDDLQVFTSHSRDDLVLADQLFVTLEFAGFTPSIECSGIHGAEDWQEKFRILISGADTVVFVLTPSSAISETCSWEVEEALAPGKRITPVLGQSLGELAPPAPRLRQRDLSRWAARRRTPYRRMHVLFCGK